MFAASSVLGLVFGATFVKFVGLGLKQLLDMERLNVPMFSSVAAIICIGYFAAVYFILLLGDLWRLRSVNPLDLWKATNEREKNRAAHGSSELRALSRFAPDMRLQSE